MQDEQDEAIYRILEDLAEKRREVWHAHIGMPSVEVNAGKWLLREGYLTSASSKGLAGVINPRGLHLYNQLKYTREHPRRVALKRQLRRIVPTPAVTGALAAVVIAIVAVISLLNG